MASLLNSGALPLELKMVENRTISATLGSDSVNDSVRAGLIGILAVAAFMLLFYRLPGLVANFALAIYVLIVVVVLAAINATLTLPGIAGIILSVGMAVDANVIIFERVKEELRNGKTIGSAVESGFRRALWTIIDANVTTLIGAAVLIKFATGPVQGFGVTLGIGILVSMLTAVLITRLLMRLVVQSGAGNWQFLFFGRQGVREA
jgi:preprotein translocase subunit SecD